MKKYQTIYVLSIKCYQYKINQYKPFVKVQRSWYFVLNDFVLLLKFIITNLLRYCIIVSEFLGRNVC